MKLFDSRIAADAAKAYGRRSSAARFCQKQLGDSQAA